METEKRNYLSRKQAADYIGIGLTKFATIQNQIAQIRFGNVIKFRRCDIDKWLESKLVQPKEK